MSLSDDILRAKACNTPEQSVITNNMDLLDAFKDFLLDTLNRPQKPNPCFFWKCDYAVVDGCSQYKAPAFSSWAGDG